MKRLAKLVGLCVLGITMGGRGRAAERDDREDARLTTFFKKYLDEEFRHRPMEATRLGDHRFDHLLDDLSPKARAATTARTRTALADLPRQIDVKKLSPSARVDYQILEHHLKRSLWLDEHTNAYATEPTLYF